MKTKLFIALLGCLLITACNKDNSLIDSFSEEEIVEMKVNKNPHLQGAAITRPLKIKGGGDIFYSIVTDPIGETVLLIEIKGTGNATHLGKFDLYLSYYQNMYGEPLSVPSGYQVAANGDKLMTHLRTKVVDGIPPQGEDEGGFYQYYEYTDGTGKFEGASGWVKLYFEFMPPPPQRPNSYSNFGEGELTF